MNTSQLLQEINRFNPSAPIDEAWTPPASWYISQAFFDLECRHIFPHTWQPVVRADQVKQAGDFVSGCLAGNPWVVLRDEEGRLQAFHNVCRHKGREVVQGSGNAGSLVCGYHAWAYRLDGRLQSAPRMAGIKNFDREAMSLPRYQVEQWGPWVFINGDLKARPLAQELQTLTDRLRATGWDDLVYYGSKEWIIQCNWKVYADNYLDGGYHIPHMHPSLDAQLNMDSYQTELFERYSIQSSQGAAESDDRIDYDPRERIGQGALYAWLYPNFMLNRYGPCLDSNYVIPLTKDSCRVVYDFYFEQSAGDQGKRFTEESIEQSDITQREDIAICESVQVGLRSTSYDQGRYAPTVEIGEHHFHKLLHGDFSAAGNGKGQ